MAHWLMKSEPSVYPWSQLVKEGRTSWNGVRNYQANNNMKAMRLGDEAFFYHSNEERAIVGIMKVVKLWHPDPSAATGRFGMVDVAPVKALKRHVTLAEIKASANLQDLALLKQSRLSVCPISDHAWEIILQVAAVPACDVPRKPHQPL